MAKARSRANGEGTIFKRTRNGNTKWYAELVNGHDDATGNKRVLRHSADTRKEVADWLVARQKERTEGTLTVPTKATVEEFMAKWIEKVAPMQVGSSTLRLYRNVFDWYIKPHLGQVPLAQLKPQQIQGMFHDLLQAGKSPRTVQLARVALRRALQQAVEWSELARNPVDVVKPPRVEHQEMLCLEPDQIVQFLEAAKSERLHALFALAVLTGLRKGELLALRWQDVDLMAGKLTVAQTMKIELVKGNDDKMHERWGFGQTKTKASRRTISIPSVALVALRHWQEEQQEARRVVGDAWARPELVFTSEIGTPMHPKNLRDRAFMRVLKTAGLPKIRFHDLRHSCATLLADQGVSDLVMQRVLGHSHINITKTLYAHVLERQKEEAAQKVDAFLAAAEKRLEEEPTHKPVH